MDDVQKEMEQVKAEIESGDNSPALMKTYGLLANALSKCSTVNQVTQSTIRAPFSPAASLCINGAIAGTDPSYQRPSNASTGSGNLCPTLTAGVNKEYDTYSFNMTGCAAFPTEITITTCGPAGCTHLGNTDTVLYLYRNVAAGDPLTANGGLPAVFNPAAPCTNLRASQDDLGTTVGTTNNPGGSTCNQIVGANCVAPCTTPSNAGALSGMRRNLGNGRFTVVVAGFGDTTTGSYNLYVNVPAAGCAVALAPTDASGNISGRVVTSTGAGIAKATLTVSGGGLGAPVTLRTNSFGYYNFSDLPTGGTYIVTVSSKMHTFAVPTRAVTLEENAADIDFVSEQ